ncbi:MAG: NAD-binding protein [Sandaracinaceae bacterium]
MEDRDPSGGVCVVCGLGSVGQHCVRELARFGVTVRAVSLEAEPSWEIEGADSALERLVVGDAREARVLADIGIGACRTLLAVTSDDRTNLDIALAARVLQPDLRLVVRSAKENLNELLARQLGNYVAYEPTEITAPAFAAAAIERDLMGFFRVDGHLFQVVQRTAGSPELPATGRSLSELRSRGFMLLTHEGVDDGDARPEGGRLRFFAYPPERALLPGERVVAIEADTPMATAPGAPGRELERSSGWRAALRALAPSAWLRRAVAILRGGSETRIQQVALITGATVLGLLTIGTLALALGTPDRGPVQAFFAAAILLLGGFGDLFEQVATEPWWVRSLGLGMTVAGIAFTGVLYALLTEKLLSLRLRFVTEPPLPQQGHVVVVGLGRVGLRVARLLVGTGVPVIGITTRDVDLPWLATVRASDPRSALTQVNLDGARSIVAAAAEELDNLEVGLQARSLNPAIEPVLRAYGSTFSDRLRQLFPYAHVLSVSALAAEVFATAAFGENVLSLFRLAGETVLVTDYRVERGDTLHGRLIAEMAYGYGVVPIYYAPRGKGRPRVHPADDQSLSHGDRMVVLATMEGLQRIERGTPRPPTHRLEILSLLAPTAAFVGATEVARVAGCSLAVARALFLEVPATLEKPIYEHQGVRLVSTLARHLVKARLVPVGGAHDAASSDATSSDATSSDATSSDAASSPGGRAAPADRGAVE